MATLHELNVDAANSALRSLLNRSVTHVVGGGVSAFRRSWSRHGLAGAVIGNATPLGIVGGLLGVNKALTGGTPDICPTVLAVARGQAVPGAAPREKAGAPAARDPGAVLKNLFR